MKTIDLKQTRKNTKTTVFLTAMLADGCRIEFFTGIKDYTTNKNNSPFINAFINDVNKPWLDHHIFLVYRLELTNKFMLIDKRLRSLPNYATDYHYVQNSEDMIVYVFEISDIWKTTYNLFKEGLYSKFDNNYKIDILRFWKLGIDNDIFSYLFLTKATENNPTVNKDQQYAIDEHLEKPDLDIESIPEMLIIEKKDYTL